MAAHHIDAFDEHSVIVGKDLLNTALLPSVSAPQDQDRVVAS
jgi:hypothetical protein